VSFVGEFKLIRQKNLLVYVGDLNFVFEKLYKMICNTLFFLA